MNENPIKIYHTLLPLAALYRIGVSIRNKLFDWGLLHAQSFPFPVISVGNITVGGTGKTPHTEYLIRLLEADYRVAVLSRGYKRKSKGFVLADVHTPIEEIGDEPYQMAHKFPRIRMAVDADRCHGIGCLTDGRITPLPEVIILDDAFQHRYVKPGLSILLIDYNRPIWKDRMLPAGRLREPQGGTHRADIIIVSKCPPHLSPDEQVRLRDKIAPHHRQEVYFTTLVYGKLRPLFTQALPQRPLNSLQADEQILLVTGIASPAAIIQELHRYVHQVVPQTFADHHHFTKADMEHIRQAFLRLPEHKRLIIVTEKDAARLIDNALLCEELKPYMYVLPVEVSFLANQKQMFHQNLIRYVTENSRNSCISQR